MPSKRHKYLVIYDKIKTWSVYALVAVAFFATGLGFEQLQQAALVAAFFVVASVVFDIYEQTARAEGDGSDYVRFNDAATDFRKKVDELVRLNADVSIEWIGMTMEYGGPAILDILSSLSNTEFGGKVTVSVVMLDPHWGTASLNPTWPPKVSASSVVLENSLRRSTCSLFYYSMYRTGMAFYSTDDTSTWVPVGGTALVVTYV